MKVTITTPDIQKTALRVPRELHTAIHKAAEKSGRTMNAEIVHRLEQSFEPAKADTKSGMHALVYTIFKESSDDFEKELKDRFARFAGKMLEGAPDYNVLAELGELIATRINETVSEASAEEDARRAE